MSAVKNDILYWSDVDLDFIALILSCLTNDGHTLHSGLSAVVFSRAIASESGQHDSVR